VPSGVGVFIASHVLRRRYEQRQALLRAATTPLAMAGSHPNRNGAKTMSDSIICPNCKADIPLSEAISHQVEERLRAEFDSERHALIAQKEQLVADSMKLMADKEAEIEAARTQAREDAVAEAEAKATAQSRQKCSP